jgi:TFIIH basal transcription factor complex TTD-A subunit
MSYAGSDPYGVRVMSGTLVTCDSAAKQIILHLDEQRPGSHKFVMRDSECGRGRGRWPECAHL